MNPEIKNLNDVQEWAKNSEGYMLTVTFLNKGRLDTFYLSNKFKKDDMLRCHKEARELIVTDLEKPIQNVPLIETTNGEITDASNT